MDRQGGAVWLCCDVQWLERLLRERYRAYMHDGMYVLFGVND
jgi:hypothetical protein